MLNHNPIFINGFSRGGTNILMNLLLSHPGTAMPSGELHKVISGGANGDRQGDKRRKKIFYNAPVSLLLGKSFFHFRNLDERSSLNGIMAAYIDYILYSEKNRATQYPGHNKYIRDNEEFKDAELRKTRLVCKNLDGLVQLTEAFQKMYPDATFICIVRNGVALLESNLRRGFSVEEFSERFNKIANKMLLLQDQFPNYRIIRYEDMIVNLLKTMQEVYEFVGLDIGEVEKVRFQLKSTVSSSGTVEKLGQKDRSLVWYELEDVQNYIRPDVNANQMKNLHSEEIERFIDKNSSVMHDLGYKI